MVDEDNYAKALLLKNSSIYVSNIGRLFNSDSLFVCVIFTSFALFLYGILLVILPTSAELLLQRTKAANYVPIDKRNFLKRSAYTMSISKPSYIDAIIENTI